MPGSKRRSSVIRTGAIRARASSRMRFLRSTVMLPLLARARPRLRFGRRPRRSRSSSCRVTCSRRIARPPPHRRAFSPTSSAHLEVVRPRAFQGHFPRFRERARGIRSPRISRVASARRIFRRASRTRAAAPIWPRSFPIHSANPNRERPSGASSFRRPSCSGRSPLRPRCTSDFSDHKCPRRSSCRPHRCLRRLTRRRPSLPSSRKNPSFFRRS